MEWRRYRSRLRVQSAINETTNALILCPCTAYGIPLSRVLTGAQYDQRNANYLPVIPCTAPGILLVKSNHRSASRPTEHQHLPIPHPTSHAQHHDNCNQEGELGKGVWALTKFAFHTWRQHCFNFHFISQYVGGRVGERSKVWEPRTFILAPQRKGDSGESITMQLNHTHLPPSCHI